MPETVWKEEIQTQNAADDEPATVISRLQTYHKSTAPLKDYYGKQGKLVTVEGQDKVEDTSKLVLEAVKA